MTMVYWTASSLACKYQHADSTLASPVPHAKHLHPLPNGKMFVRAIKSGGLLVPSEEWLQEAEAMYDILLELQAKNKKETGEPFGSQVLTRWKCRLAESFPCRSEMILKDFCLMALIMSVTSINIDRIESKSKIRAGKKTQEFIFAR